MKEINTHKFFFGYYISENVKKLIGRTEIHFLKVLTKIWSYQHHEIIKDMDLQVWYIKQGRIRLSDLVNSDLSVGYSAKIYLKDKVFYLDVDLNKDKDNIKGK